MTKEHSDESTPHQEPEFELTLYLIERRIDGRPRFLMYGRSIPQGTARPYLRSRNKEEEIRIRLTDESTDREWVPIDLVIQQVSLSKSEHEEFLQSLQAGEVSIPLVGPEENRTGFKVTRRPPVIQLDKETLQSNLADIRPPESGFGVMAQMESFWPEHKDVILLDALDPVSDSNLPQESNEQDVELFRLEAEREIDRRIQRLVLELKNLTGLSFDDAYSERLCNVETAEVPFHSHLSNSPISISVEKEGIPEKKEILYKGVAIHRVISTVGEAMWAHVILRNYGDVVLDKLVQLQKNEDKTTIISKEMISEFEVRVFDPSEDNEVVFVERRLLIRSINLTGNLLSGTMIYRDRLTERLASRKSEIGKKLENASPFTDGIAVTTGGNSHDPWAPAAQTMRRLIGSRGLPSKSSRWFPCGLSEEGHVVEYLRGIIDNPKNKEVLIVDPFFGLSAFGLLIPRLRRAGLKTTIVTSCLGGDPDKEDARAKSGRCQGSCRIKFHHAASFWDRFFGLRTTLSTESQFLV